MQADVIEYHCNAILQFAQALKAKSILHYKPLPQMAYILKERADIVGVDVLQFEEFDHIPPGSVDFEIAVSMHYLDHAPMVEVANTLQNLYKHGRRGLYLSLTPKGGEESPTLEDAAARHPGARWHEWDTSSWFRTIVQHGPRTHNSEILTLANGDDVQYLVKHARMLAINAAGSPETIGINGANVNVA